MAILEESKELRRVELLSTIQLPRPFQTIIDETMLLTLESFFEIIKRISSSSNNCINSITLTPGISLLVSEHTELFREEFRKNQREAIVQTWTITGYSVEEAARDVIMCTGDTDPVVESTHREHINEARQTEILHCRKSLGTWDRRTKRRHVMHTNRTAYYPRSLPRTDAVQDSRAEEFLDATRWASPDLVASRNYYSDECIPLHYTFHCNSLGYVTITISIR